MMAPEASDPSSASEADVSVAELVFSCCICQATVTDVYATVESNQGFHSGSSGEDGIVTKMYITSCSHVTCSKHLENGAVPFYPEHQQPRAACPKCTQEKQNNSPKDLFAIQGLNEGQYDPTIPDMWMHCPAIKLDDSIEGMDAIRFQYMALCHYGREVRRHWKAAEQKRSVAETTLIKERKLRKRLQSEQDGLQKKIEALEKKEAQLKKWEDRKPVINHYVNAFGELTKDNSRMRNQLIALGYDVPLRKYQYEPEETSKSGQKHNEIRETDAADKESSSSARKRKYGELSKAGELEIHRQSSRDLMPPPLPRKQGVQQHSTIQNLPEHLPTMNRPQSLQPFLPHESPRRQRQKEVPQNQLRPEQILSHQNFFQRPQSQSRPIVSSRVPHPSPASIHHSQAENHHPGGYAPALGLDAAHYDPIPLASLSIHSTGLDERQWGHPTSDGRAMDAEYYAGLPNTALSYGGPARHQFVSQETYEHQSDLPLNAAPHLYSRPPSVLRSRMEGYGSLQMLQPVAHSDNRYSHSPFFKRGLGDSRPETMQRPPARGYDYQHRSTKDDGDHGLPGMSGVGAQRYVESRQSSRRFGSNIYQPNYQPSQGNSRPGTNHNHHARILQTPRNSQTPRRQPDCPAPPVFRSPQKPDLRNNTGRITLPPSTANAVPFAIDQDAAMSQIPGVRGVSSHQNARNYQAPFPNYNLSRPLYSAGPRQVIRR